MKRTRPNALGIEALESRLLLSASPGRNDRHGDAAPRHHRPATSQRPALISVAMSGQLRPAPARVVPPPRAPLAAAAVQVHVVRVVVPVVVTPVILAPPVLSSVVVAREVPDSGEGEFDSAPLAPVVEPVRPLNSVAQDFAAFETAFQTTSRVGGAAATLPQSIPAIAKAEPDEDEPREALTFEPATAASTQLVDATFAAVGAARIWQWVDPEEPRGADPDDWMRDADLLQVVDVLFADDLVGAQENGDDSERDPHSNAAPYAAGPRTPSARGLKEIEADDDARRVIQPDRAHVEDRREDVSDADGMIDISGFADGATLEEVACETAMLLQGASARIRSQERIPDEETENSARPTGTEPTVAAE